MTTILPMKIARNWRKIFYDYNAMKKLSSEELVKVRMKKFSLYRIYIRKYLKEFH